MAPEQKMEFKVGPIQTRSFSAGVLASLQILPFLFACFAAIEILMVIGGSLRPNPISWSEVLIQPANLVLAGIFIGASVAACLAQAKRLAFAWVLMESEYIRLIFRNTGKQERVAKVIPYDWISACILSHTEASVLYYRKNRVGVFGLDSLIGLGQRTEEELRQVAQHLQSKCPGIQVYSSAQDRLNKR